MVKRAMFIFLLVAAFLLLAAVVQTKDEIKLDVYPKFLICMPGQRPAVRIMVTIERHADNRHRSLAVVSDVGQSNVSTNEMEGENDAKVFTTTPQVSCADYLITACVYRVTKGKSQSFCAKQEVRIPDDP